MSLQEYRQGLRDKREDAEVKAKAKAEWDALTTEEARDKYHKLAENPLREPDAPKPPIDAEIEELTSRIDRLPPEAQGDAFGRLAELQRERTSMRRAEIESTTGHMRLQQEQALAAYNAQTTHINMVDQQFQANFQQAYGVPMSMEGIEWLQANAPEYAAAAMQAMLMRDSQMREAQALMAQHEEMSAANDSMLAAVEDEEFTHRMKASDPDVFDSSGRIKPEISAGVLNYVGSMGIDRDTFKSLLASNAKVPMRDHRFQQLVIDAARYRMAKSKATEAKKAPLPPVQRPGEATGGIRHTDAEFDRLEGKSSLTIKQAARLNQLRRQRNA